MLDAFSGISKLRQKSTFDRLGDGLDPRFVSRLQLVVAMHLEQSPIDKVQCRDAHRFLGPAAQVGDVDVVIEHHVRRRVGFTGTSQQPKHSQRRESEDQVEGQELGAAKIEGVHHAYESAVA